MHSLHWMRGLGLLSGICVLRRSGGRGSAACISSEVLEFEFDELAVIFKG
jgi:hypothetical protein